MCEIIHGNRPFEYNKVFWEELKKYRKTEQLFKDADHDWNLLSSPHKEICIGFHNKAMEEG